MRPTTKYWFGLNHVGEANSLPSVMEMTWPEAIRWWMKIFSEISLAKRVDIVVGRTSEEVMDRLMLKPGTGVGSRSRESTESIEAELEAMMADLGLEDGDI